MSKFSPHAQTATAQPGAQTAQANGPGQQPAALDPVSVRLDPLGRPMSIDHEHQVSTLSWLFRQGAMKICTVFTRLATTGVPGSIYGRVPNGMHLCQRMVLHAPQSLSWRSTTALCTDSCLQSPYSSLL